MDSCLVKNYPLSKPNSGFAKALEFDRPKHFKKAHNYNFMADRESIVFIDVLKTFPKIYFSSILQSSLLKEVSLIEPKQENMKKRKGQRERQPSADTRAKTNFITLFCF